MAAYFPNLARHNLALYTIPAAWVIAVAPRFIGAQLYKKSTNNEFDSRAPRDFAKTVTDDATLDAKTQGQITRCEAAQANGFENLGLFAAAVAAGSAAGVSPKLLNTISYAYLVSRVAYNYIYINNETAGAAQARSVAYMVGLGGIMTLFVTAGNKLRVPLLA